MTINSLSSIPVTLTPLQVFQFPKIFFMLTIPKTVLFFIKFKESSKVDRKTRDSNKNVKSYASLENVKLPVQYSHNNHHVPQKAPIQTVIYEPPIV